MQYNTMQCNLVARPPFYTLFSPTGGRIFFFSDLPSTFNNIFKQWVTMFVVYLRFNIKIQLWCNEKATTSKFTQKQQKKRSDGKTSDLNNEASISYSWVWTFTKHIHEDFGFDLNWLRLSLVVSLLSLLSNFIKICFITIWFSGLSVKLITDSLQLTLLY